MAERTSGRSTRRTVLKASTVPIIGSLAGCLSDDDENALSLVTGPSAYYAVVMTYVQNEGILEEKLDDAGYSVGDWTETFDERPLLAGDQVNVAHPSVLETAQIARESDIELAVAGKVATNFLGMFVQTGGEYDPDNTGGIEESLERISEDGGTVGIGTFGGSDFPGFGVVFESIYGYDFSENQEDFDIRSIGYPAVPAAIADGEIAMGGTSPMHQAAGLIENDEIKPLFWALDELGDAGLGVSMQYNVVCRESYIQEHEDAVRALVDAWDEGLDWFYENAADAMDDDEYFDAFDWADTVEEAKYAHDWATQDLDEGNPDFSVMYQDAHLDDEWIADKEAFLDQAAEIGFAPENWDDFVNFHSLS